MASCIVFKSLVLTTLVVSASLAVPRHHHQTAPEHRVLSHDDSERSAEGSSSNQPLRSDYHLVVDSNEDNHHHTQAQGSNPFNDHSASKKRWTANKRGGALGLGPKWNSVQSDNSLVKNLRLQAPPGSKTAFKAPPVAIILAKVDANGKGSHVLNPFNLENRKRNGSPVSNSDPDSALHKILTAIHKELRTDKDPHAPNISVSDDVVNNPNQYDSGKQSAEHNRNIKQSTKMHDLQEMLQPLLHDIVNDRALTPADLININNDHLLMEARNEVNENDSEADSNQLHYPFTIDHHNVLELQSDEDDDSDISQFAHQQGQFNSHQESHSLERDGVGSNSCAAKERSCDINHKDGRNERSEPNTKCALESQNCSVADLMQADHNSTISGRDAAHDKNKVNKEKPLALSLNSKTYKVSIIFQ